MAELKCEWQAEAKLGEGPVWVAEENAVYWVDIFKKQVHRFAENDQHTWTFDTQVTSLARRKQGGWIATVRDGYAFIDFERNQIDPIMLPEADILTNRFNDGKVDAAGRYWAGSMNDGGKLPTGVLYCLDHDLSLRRMDDQYIITNGPTFSVDQKTLYHTDTIRRTIYAFDFNADGSLTNKRVFVQLTQDDEGSPDGMTVDSENCVWLCHFGGARMTRYSPQGEILTVIPMPCPNITSCTFGGAQLDTLYITTARLDSVDSASLAGSLFSYKPGVTGLPTPLFAG